MNRLPWFSFYPADWIKGTRELSHPEKAIWIDLLAYMWESPTRGKIVSDWPGIARMTGTEWLECSTIVTELSNKKVLEVTEANQKVTIISRRMQREEKHRESNRIKQRNFKKRLDNQKVTDKTQKSYSEVIKDKDLKTKTLAPSGLLPIPKESLKKPLTDIQKVITVFKMVSGFPKEDKEWDKMYFSRYSKSAKSLIEFLGSWKQAGYCVEEIYEKLTAKGLTVTMETICKHSGDWKKDYLEKEAKNGVLPMSGDGSLSVK